MIYNNVDGVLKLVKSKYENLNGINKEIYKKYELVEGVLKPVHNSKIKRIPITSSDWFCDAGCQAGCVSFSNGTMTITKNALLNFWNERYLDMYNEGYKYVRFDYSYINFPVQPILCMGTASWSAKNEYRGGGVGYGWLYQTYMIKGTWNVMDMVTKTNTTDGTTERNSGDCGLTTHLRLCFGFNGVQSYSVTLKRVLVSKIKADLLNL